MSTRLVLESDGRYISPDGEVEVYQCQDGTWRAYFTAWCDKERNLTKGEAFRVAERWLEQVAAGIK